mmetsp:Transcript_26082/g.81335  ORF Transcript_26082/g.81335 Transcript_26082/m.81335 type:complete len:235 (-) Transcript_26082:888-1592(-)
MACRTAKSAMISSLPPYTDGTLYVRWNVSTMRPMPPWVTPRPPRICTAWSATRWQVRVVWYLSSAMRAPMSADCGPFKFMVCVTSYIIAVHDSMPANICANFSRMTCCSTSLFPKTLRCIAHLNVSSVHKRALAMQTTQIIQRSWLKLDMMIWKPPFTLPKMFFLGTFAPSNVTNAVPAALEYLLLMIVVLTSSLRGISIMEMPPAPLPPVRTAVTNQSAYMPPVIHFFVPRTM